MKLRRITPEQARAMTTPSLKPKADINEYMHIINLLKQKRVAEEAIRNLSKLNLFTLPSATVAELKSFTTRYNDAASTFYKVVREAACLPDSCKFFITHEHDFDTKLIQGECVKFTFFKEDDSATTITYNLWSQKVVGIN